MIQRLLGICGLIILAMFPYGAEALAQMGDARTTITWGELSIAISIFVFAAATSAGLVLWITSRNSETKTGVHKRIDILDEKMNARFLAAVEQFASGNRMTEQKVHAIELVLAQRYVTKDDLHAVEGKILQAVNTMATDLRADLRTVHDRLNAASIPNP